MSRLYSFVLPYQAVHDRELLEDRLSSSTQELTDFKDKIETLSTDLATSKQELSCAHEQLHRDRIQFQEETLKQSEEKDDLKRQFETQVAFIFLLPLHRAW